MTLAIEIDADSAQDAIVALRSLADHIEQREDKGGDALDRSTLRSGTYETITPDVRSIDIY